MFLYCCALIRSRNFACSRFDAVTQRPLPRVVCIIVCRRHFSRFGGGGSSGSAIGGRHRRRRPKMMSTAGDGQTTIDQTDFQFSSIDKERPTRCPTSPLPSAARGARVLPPQPSRRTNGKRFERRSTYLMRTEAVPSMRRSSRWPCERWASSPKRRRFGK